MLVTILTKSGGFLGSIASLMGIIMNGIYEFFLMFGIQNIALSIIVFTLIMKMLMLPLTIKQQKFSKLSTKMNPELQKIQAKYKGKKDEDSMKKMQAEQQAIYQKYGASPTSGCLPLLITLPIMFALYRVINNIPAYVDSVKVLYDNVAEAVKSTGPEFYIDQLTKLSETLKFDIGKFSEVAANNAITNDHLIDILSKFNTEKWNIFMQSFPTINVAGTVENIKNVNQFFGLSVIDSPGYTFPGILIPLLAAGLQYIQGKQMSVKNTNNDANSDNPAASAMSSMNVFMPIMSGFFGLTLPAGIGLYWIANSAISIVQQYFVNRYMDRVDMDELIEKSVNKAKKKAKKTTSTTGLSLQELAKRQTKSIDSMNDNKTNHIEDNKKDASEKEVDHINNISSTSKNPKSITEIANILKNRNIEKGDK